MIVSKSKVLLLYDKMPLPLKVSFWYFFCMMITKGMAFFSMPIFTRILSTADYGLVCVYSSWQDMLGIFITFGLSNSIFNVGLVKYACDKNNFCSSMIGLLFVFFTLSSFLIIVFQDEIHNIIQLDAKYLYIMALSSLFVCVQNMWLLRERMEYNYRSMTVFMLISSFGQVVLSVILVMIMDDKAMGKIIGTTIVSFLLGIYCFAHVINGNYCFFKKKYWAFAVKYNFPMLPHFLAGIILSQVDRVMIQKMVGFSEAGIYTVAYSIAGVIYIFNNALVSSYNPWILKRLQSKCYDGISAVVNVIMFLYWIPMLLIILFAPEVMGLIAPSDYYDGIYIIPSVVCSMFFILLFNVFAPIEHFSLKTKFLGLASIVAALLNVLLNYIFINMFGYFAAGYTTLICYMIYALAHWCYMKKCCMDIIGAELFNDKIIFLMSIGIILVALLSVSVYKYNILRYICIIFILFSMLNNRQIIKSVVFELKKR